MYGPFGLPFQIRFNVPALMTPWLRFSHLRDPALETKRPLT